MGSERERPFTEDAGAGLTVSARAPTLSGEMSEPLFSVVIPTYNRARYVAEAVQSVLDQTQPGVEVIVVDDGSQDNTADVLRQFGDRISYIQQENRGMAAARNRGIDEARGEYVGLLDSDDLWQPALLERVKEVFDEHPEAGAVFLAEQEFDCRGNIDPRVHSKRTPGKFFTPAGMIGRDTGVGSGRPPVVRRRIFDLHGTYDESLCGAWDCEIWIRYSFDVPMALLEEPLVLRRVHDDNYSSDQVKDSRAWLAILERVAERHPEFPAQHPRVYRRTLGKNHLRLGRELLARSAVEPELRREARRHLWSSIRTYPWFGRAWSYLAWSYLTPESYALWRRYQLSRR